MEDSAVKYISIRRAASLLGVSENTVRKHFDSGELAGFKSPGGHRKLKLASVIEMRDRLQNDSDGILFLRGKAHYKE